MLPYATSINDGRQKCCFELYQNGLLHREDRQYCFNHIALVPNVNTIRNIISREDKFDVVPVYYLLMVEEEVGDHTHDTIVDNSRSYYSYKQNRQLKVYEDKETETIRDSKRMGGVDAYSPFHLTGAALSTGRVAATTGGSIAAGELYICYI